jgi:hypothetical protein
MEDVEVGVISMGSRGGASVEPEDGRIGIDLCRFGLCGSGEKGLRRASATEAITAGGFGGRTAVVKCCAVRSEQRCNKLWASEAW